jgi:hypothetical protein
MLTFISRASLYSGVAGRSRPSSRKGTRSTTSVWGGGRVGGVRKRAGIKWD